MSSPDDLKYLAVTDIETTGLDRARDEILEVATILVTTELEEVARFERVLKISDQGLDRLRNDEFVLRMHEKSGLLSASMLSTNTQADCAQDWSRFFLTKVENYGDTIALAGSGVGHFDFEFLKQEFPLVAQNFVYFPLDISDVRRVTTMFNGGKSVIRPVEESFVEGFKEHRAMADAEAHLAEFRRYRDWVKGKA